MLVFTLLLASALAATELSCVDGIVDVSPRPYMGEMSMRDCRSKAEKKGVSFVYGNGRHCHHYKVLLDSSKKANDGKGHWETCGVYTVKDVFSTSYIANAKKAVGPDIMCIVGEFDFYFAHMENRCASAYEVNRYTGKCVPKSQNSIEPENCVNSCGSGFCCQADSGLCLKCGGGKTESAHTKTCDELYGCAYQPCMWHEVGETANEEALGLSFDSDEQAESVAVTKATGSTSGFDVTVEAFAALGFAITLYGAYRHYIK